jgi:hypothetical protein
MMTIKRMEEEKPMNRRYPVIDRLLHKTQSNGRDYYTLGMASTKRGAIRVLRRAGRVNVTDVIFNMRGEWIANENSLGLGGRRSI